MRGNPVCFKQDPECPEIFRSLGWPWSGPCGRLVRCTGLGPSRPGLQFRSYHRLVCKWGSYETSLHLRVKYRGMHVRARDQCLAPISVLALFMIINFQTFRVRIMNPGVWSQNVLSLFTPGHHYPSLKQRDQFPEPCQEPPRAPASGMFGERAKSQSGLWVWLSRAGRAPC